jgi:hypothetical protein
MLLLLLTPLVTMRASAASAIPALSTSRHSAPGLPVAAAVVLD